MENLESSRPRRSQLAHLVLLVGCVAAFSFAAGRFSSEPTGRSVQLSLQLQPFAAPSPKPSGWQHLPTECSDPAVALICSPHGWKWVEGPTKLWNASTGCQHLERCNYTKLAFVGDSYVRHIMQGVALILTGDYEHGSMKASGKTAQCRGDGQFEEKVCRSHVNHQVHVCNSRIALQLDYSAWPTIAERHRQFDAVFWGCGRHPVDGAAGDSNKGWIQGTDIGRPRVFWLQGHARLSPGLPDERPEMIRRYNQEVARAMDSLCHIPSIDLHTSTAELIRQLPDEAASMTHDGAHWSRTVNVVFAQQLLNRLIEKCQ